MGMLLVTSGLLIGSIALLLIVAGLWCIERGNSKRSPSDPKTQEKKKQKKRKDKKGDDDGADVGLLEIGTRRDDAERDEEEDGPSCGKLGRKHEDEDVDEDEEEEEDEDEDEDEDAGQERRGGDGERGGSEDEAGIEGVEDEAVVRRQPSAQEAALPIASAPIAFVRDPDPPALPALNPPVLPVPGLLAHVPEDPSPRPLQEKKSATLGRPMLLDMD